MSISLRIESLLIKICLNKKKILKLNNKTKSYETKNKAEGKDEKDCKNGNYNKKYRNTKINNEYKSRIQMNLGKHFYYTEDCVITSY